MKIAVIGLNGRMSKVTIDEIIKHPTHELAGALVREKNNHSSIKLYERIEDLAANSDAIIDFSTPRTSLEVAKKLSDTGVILVCGTTGFSDQEFKEFRNYSKNLTMVWSANMSMGINLLQMLLKTVSCSLTEDFDSAIVDIHHKHKLDSPSGTALMLANTITTNSNRNPQISSLRIGESFGEHQIIFSNANESISLTHQAFNRNIFASGAIKACSWAQNKEFGFYSMQDVLSQ